MKVTDLINLELVKFMYNYAENMLPNPILDLFHANFDFHMYNTRNRNAAIVPTHRTNIFHKSFLSRGPSVWLNVTNDVRMANSFNSCVYKYKQSCFQQY